MMGFLDILINQVLRQPPIFIGLVVLAGCLFRKLDGKATMVSVVKSVVGMMILMVGAATLISASKPVIEIFVKRIGIKGVITDMWTATAAGLKVLETDQPEVSIGLIMISAWLLHIVLSKYTPIKTVYLTGHVAYTDTVALTWLLYAVLKLKGIPLMLTAMGICAVYWWLFPSLIRPYLKPITGDTPITLGHNLCIGGILTMQLARLFGKPEDSAEKIKLPGWLSVFGDSIIAYSIIMGSIYCGIVVMAGPEITKAYAGAQNYVVYGFMQGLTMAVGITVLMQGVRMFLAEVIPAFMGISQKFIPGAVAAVDSPIFWPYAPTAALLGFICTVVGQVVGLVLLIVLNSPVIAIPSVIPLFFGGSTLGVFANAWGGWKGVIGATSIMGVVEICGSAGLAYVSNAEYAIWGHSDWSTLWLAVFGILKQFVS